MEGRQGWRGEREKHVAGQRKEGCRGRKTGGPAGITEKRVGVLKSLEREAAVEESQSHRERDRDKKIRRKRHKEKEGTERGQEEQAGVGPPGPPINPG